MFTTYRGREGIGNITYGNFSVLRKYISLLVGYKTSSGEHYSSELQLIIFVCVCDIRG
jgi:hypothetical protein